MTEHRRSNLFAVAISMAALLLSVPLVLGFLKYVHPAFDSFAHLRAHLAVLLALTAFPLLFLARWRAYGALALALAIMAFTSVLDLSLLHRFSGSKAEASAPPGPYYRLLQLNLRFDNHTPKEVLSLIGRSNADVVTLEEVSGMWRRELSFIEKAYPYRQFCPRPGVGGVAILSRRPFLHPSTAKCLNRHALAIATINFGGAAVDVVALHLGWPWPFEQSQQIGPVAKTLETKLGSSAILAGDLNAAPWSATAERLAKAGGFTRLRHIGPTWLARNLPDWLRRTAGLPIDNIFVKGRVAVLQTKRLESVGSDHLPLLVEFSLLPGPQQEPVFQAGL